MANDQRDIYNDLKANGRPVLLRVTTLTGGNPATGDPGTETTRDYPTRALELALTTRERVRYGETFGLDVAMKTKSYMVAAIDDTSAALPALNSSMKIVDGASVLSIIDPGPMQPGTTVLYYSVFARGA